ncbi:DUF7344 domain-containing protein [Natronosalvus halobius]|uniref:DUF7344 domain-containing protein n=1 Tax=Natronosalvus halobius TaxID=2953746 RepID=UPI003CCC9E1D
MHALCADEQRRLLIEFLYSHANGWCTQAELIDYISENSEQHMSHKAIRLRLIHSHLPCLEDIGVIRYHKQTKAVHNWDDDIVEELYELGHS